MGSVLVFSRLFNHADYLSGACLMYIYIERERWMYIDIDQYRSV